MYPLFSHLPSAGPLPISVTHTNRAHTSRCARHFALLSLLCPALHHYRPFFLSLSAQHGLTPLHWAAYHGHVEVANALLLKGADIQATTQVRKPSQSPSPWIRPRLPMCVHKPDPVICAQQLWAGAALSEI